MIVSVGESDAAGRGRLARLAFGAAGCVLAAVGVAGIFLPLLPTTVFLLLAAACFARSWPAAHRWLTTNRVFGRYLRNYGEERGATAATKAVTIAVLWAGMGASVLLFSPPWWVGGVLAAVAVGVTIHLLVLKTIRPGR